MVDGFTKTALTMMVIIAGVFVISAYIGHVLGSKMEGTDSIVEDTAASSAFGAVPQATHVGPTITSVVGEPIGFTFADVVAGLIVGYYWTDIFRREEDA